MVDKRVPDNDDELGVLGPMIEAVLANVPDDAQWAAVQERLKTTLELAALQPANPSTLAEQRRRRTLPSKLRWLTAAAAAVAVVVVVLFLNGILRFSILPMEEESGGGAVAVDAQKSYDSSATRPHPNSLLTGDGTVGRVEQTYAVFVRPKNSDRERPLGSEDVLRAGDALRVAPQGGLQVRLDDGSRLWLTANTEAECVGTRSNDRPAWRLTRGEIQADIAHGTEKFRIATPGGGLKVLGTEFHVRVYPNEEPIPKKETIPMKIGINSLQRAIVVLTVLTGSVALEANGQEKVVLGGTRATYDDGGGAFGFDVGVAGTENVSQIDYIKKWVAARVNQPGDATQSEVLAQVTLAPSMLTRLVAINTETGAVRPLADFVGAGVDVKPAGSGLAFAGVTSILHSTKPVSGAGNSITEDTAVLVDTRQGDKVTLQPLTEWDAFYPQMSPDRRKIAFIGCHQRNFKEYGLYVTDLETFKPTLALKGGLRTVPAWSPDSRWIAISKAEGYTNAHEIVLIDTVDGTVKPTKMKGAGAAFSADGKQIVYVGGFKQQGSWSAGVPTSGNLFIAAVPDGQPEQLTQLPNGGAMQPVFSPDGSYVAYTVRPMGKDEVGIHIADVKARKDAFTCDISKESARLSDALHWVGDRSKLVGGYQRPSADKKSQELCIIQVERKDGGEDAGWKMSNPTFKFPDYVNDEGIKKISDRLMEVFKLNSAAIRANDLQAFAEAQKTYTEACDRIEKIDKDLELGAIKNSKLVPSDLQPYLAVMRKRASEATSAEHAAKAVHDNLEYYLDTALSGYYARYEQFPPAEKQSGDKAAPTFADWAMNPDPKTMQFQVNHVRGDDRARVRRMFVVPGDDPEKMATSYKVVRSGKDELVLRTPVLPDGKRLEATYKVKGIQTYKDRDGKERKSVRIEGKVTEVK